MSLVEVDSERVASVARKTITLCQEAREREIAPFERKIQDEIARRNSITRRWFKPSPDRGKVISYLSDDWSWGLNYMFAKQSFEKTEEVANRLLTASKESKTVLVSTNEWSMMVLE